MKMSKSSKVKCVVYVKGVGKRVFQFVCMGLCTAWAKQNVDKFHTGEYVLQSVYGVMK